jgi:hypothetical protein
VRHARHDPGDLLPSAPGDLADHPPAGPRQADAHLAPGLGVGLPVHEAGLQQAVDRSGGRGRVHPEGLRQLGHLLLAARGEDDQQPELGQGDRVVDRGDRTGGDRDQQPGRGQHRVGDGVDLVVDRRRSFGR